VTLAKGDVAGGEAEARGALEELAAIWGPSSWKVGANRAGWSETLLRRHVLPAAAAEADQAIALLAPTDQSADGLRVARAIRALCLARLGHARAALPEAESALAAEEKASAPGSYLLLLPSVAVGEAALATGDAAGAVSVLERAVAIADEAEPFPELHADAHLALARALLATHGDPSRARQMAERAAKEYEGVALPDLAAEARRVAGD
jgi:tetratricopeptide (TPR) repeat protein